MAVIGNAKRTRRRRVISEDPIVESADSALHQQESDVQDGLHYTSLALPDHQICISRLLPQRPFLMIVIWLLGLVTIAILALFHILAIERQAGRESMARWALNSHQSFASWCSSLLLAIAAALSVFLYWLRRQRIDDYKGHYRIWIPIACLLIVCSVHATTNFAHSAWEGGLEYLQQLSAVGPMLLNIFLGSIAVFLTARVFYELRSSRMGAFCFLMAALSYLGSFGFSSQILNSSAPLTGMLNGVCVLFGHWMFVMSQLTYVRHIFLDAQGLIVAKNLRAERTAKHQAAKSADASESGKAKRKSQPAKAPSHSTSKSNEPQNRPTKRVAAEPSEPTSNQRAEKKTKSGSQVQKPAEESDDDILAMNPRMSKSQRKRLRKEKRRQTRAA